MAAWNASTAGGKGDRLKKSRDGFSAFPRRDGGEGADDGQARQAIGHSHAQQATGKAAELPPVRNGVEREVRNHAEREGGQRAPDGAADERAGQDVIGHQHAHNVPRRSTRPGIASVSARAGTPGSVLVATVVRQVRTED